jgi:hypothetical protein
MSLDLNKHRDLIYNALIHAIRTNSGIGFKNCDQGHPAYSHGAEANTGGQGDSPEDNELFAVLRGICQSQEPPDSLPQIDTWKSFCELAVKGYADNRSST